MSKPLVVQVLWTLGRGGAERMAFALAERLPERGYRAHVIAANGGGEMASDFVRAGISLSVGTPRHAGVSRLMTLIFLRTEIRRLRPDIWHTHLGGDTWGGWAARSSGLRPWVITAHGMEDEVGGLLRRARRWAFRHADHVVCVSRSVRENLRANYGVAEERLSVIPNGIDLAKVIERPRGAFHDVPRLITVGRLVPGKRHDVLLKALARVRRPWTLTVLGAGPMRRDLERLTVTLGLMARVRYLGSVGNVAEHLSQADLFCFPTASEGQGLALYEAAAAGVPVVVSDLPAFREAFDDAAVRYVSGDADYVWADAITESLMDPGTAFTRAGRAQAIVREKFSLATMVKSYDALYRRLLRDRESRI